MDSLRPFDARDLMRAQVVSELRGCNDLTSRYGLVLRAEEIGALAERRVQALRDTGRFEFAGGVFAKLAYAFCDSPYLNAQNYAETLGELVENFYYFKGEAMEWIGDDELIDLMKQFFDGVCQGSVDYLSGTSLEELCRRIRTEGEGAYGEQADAD